MIKISWEQYIKDIYQLGKLVRRSRRKFDILVVVARGGLPLGTFLSHYLKLPVAIVSCARYASRKKEIKVSPEISTLYPLEGKILLVDELVDEGATLLFIKDWIREKIHSHRKTKIATGVLYRKPRSLLKPDFYVKDLEEEWVVFPYEIQEQRKKNRGKV